MLPGTMPGGGALRRMRSMRRGEQVWKHPNVLSMKGYLRGLTTFIKGKYMLIGVGDGCAMTRASTLGRARAHGFSRSPRARKFALAMPLTLRSAALTPSCLILGRAAAMM